MAKQIKSVEELKKSIAQGHNDFYIILAGGGAKSSKWIDYDETSGLFAITNLIDDSEQDLTEKQLMNSHITNIGKAMKLGALIQE